MGRGTWICMLVLSALLTAPSHPAHGEATDAQGVFGIHSVWVPSNDALEEMRRDCLGVEGVDEMACVAQVMERFGASSSARTFSRMASELAFMNKFEEVGLVDVAYVLFPFRANENQGCYLVNGEPPLVDVDDFELLDKASLERNAQYKAIRGEYPQVTLWPGDRSPEGFLSYRIFEDGRHRFVFDYYLRDGCRACPMVGVAVFAFDFDPWGRFEGSELAHLMRIHHVPGAGMPKE